MCASTRRQSLPLRSSRRHYFAMGLFLSTLPVAALVVIHGHSLQMGPHYYCTLAVTKGTLRWGCACPHHYRTLLLRPSTAISERRHGLLPALVTNDARQEVFFCLSRSRRSIPKKTTPIHIVRQVPSIAARVVSRSAGKRRTNTKERFYGSPPNFSLPKSPVLKPAHGRIS